MKKNKKTCEIHIHLFSNNIALFANIRCIANIIVNIISTRLLRKHIMEASEELPIFIRIRFVIVQG